MALARISSLFHNISPAPTTVYGVVRNSDGMFFVFADGTVWMTDGTQAGTPTDLGPLTSEPAFIKPQRGRKMTKRIVYSYGQDGELYEIAVGPTTITETFVDTTNTGTLFSIYCGGDPEISGRESVRFLNSGGQICGFDAASLVGTTHVLEVLAEDAIVGRHSFVRGGVYDWSEDGSTGFAVGAKTALSANAAGTTWDGDSGLAALWIAGGYTGIACLAYTATDIYRFALTSNGRLYRSKNGGTWSLSFSPSGGVLPSRGIRRLNGNLFAYGLSGYVYSSNNGDTWVEHTVGTSQPNRWVCGVGYDSGSAKYRALIVNESASNWGVYETTTPATDSSWASTFSTSGSFPGSVFGGDVSLTASEFAARISATQIRHSTDGVTFATYTETDADYQADTQLNLDIANGQVVAWGGRFVFYSTNGDALTKVEIVELLTPAYPQEPFTDRITCVRYDSRTSGMDLFAVSLKGRVFKTIDATYAEVAVTDANTLGDVRQAWDYDQNSYPRRHVWLSLLATPDTVFALAVGYTFDPEAVLFDHILASSDLGVAMILAPVSAHQSAMQLIAAGAIVRDWGATVLRPAGLSVSLTDFVWKDGMYAAINDVSDLVVSQNGEVWEEVLASVEKISEA
jgi:hypothetical protein